LGCEPLEAAETALSRLGWESESQSGLVLLSVFQLLAIPEFNCDPYTGALVVLINPWSKDNKMEIDPHRFQRLSNS